MDADFEQRCKQLPPHIRREERGYKRVVLAAIKARSLTRESPYFKLQEA